MEEHYVLIGAGSAVFTVGLVADMIRQGAPTQLALVDIDPDNLEVAERLVKKKISARKAPIQVTASTNRRDVLPGATTIICTISVGGRRAWERDVFIPRKYGIYLPVGDTVGPGGASRAMRMIPAMVEIAQDVLELSPEALFFNYGNPMAPVCRGVTKATGANIVGLCHGVHDVAGYLAGKLGVQRSRMAYTAVGINHLTWFTKIMVEDLDMLPKFREIAENVVRNAPRSDSSPVDTKTDDTHPFSSSFDHPFCWQLFLTFGAFPSALDRHVTEFFPQFFRPGAYYGKILGVNEFSFEGTIASGDETFDMMREAAFSPDPLGNEFFSRMSGEHEQVIEIVGSIRQNQHHVYSVNLPNISQVPNILPEFILESPAAATREGLIALKQPPLSAALASIVESRCQWVETLVDAALEKDKGKFIQALIMEGAVSSIEQAVEMTSDLLEWNTNDR
jgi:alpha-galactosidase